MKKERGWGREDEAHKGWFALSCRSSSQSRKQKECECVCAPCGTKAVYFSSAKSTAVICWCHKPVYKHHQTLLPSSAFNNRFFVLISSSEFSFRLPCSKRVHLVLMTLEQLAADKLLACLEECNTRAHTHAHTSTRTPRPDLPPPLCALTSLKSFLLQLPSQASLLGLRGLLPRPTLGPGAGGEGGAEGCAQPWPPDGSAVLHCRPRRRVLRLL